MTREKVVCVIDDDEAARDSLAFLLETDGFVVEAYDRPSRSSMRVHLPEAVASSPM
jgi:FixJ family two-component response regulator